MAKIKHPNWCNRCIHFGLAKVCCDECEYYPDLMDNPYRFELLRMNYPDQTATANSAKAEPVIKDSGERTEFASGAVRDMHEGKGDMASVPWEAILRLSRHYENGAKKYARWNYRKGINLSSYIDSACRHLAKYQCGCDDEDHLAAAAFNILGAMLVEEVQPELIDLPLREGKNRFQYFTESGTQNG